MSQTPARPPVAVFESSDDDDGPPCLLGLAGPAVLLARSRQTPPLFVVVGCEAGGALIIKTWVGSKLASPANTIDLNQQLKVLACCPPACPMTPSCWQGTHVVCLLLLMTWGVCVWRVQGAYALEPTALSCNFDGTKIALGFKSGRQAGRQSTRCCSVCVAGV